MIGKVNDGQPIVLVSAGLARRLSVAFALLSAGSFLGVASCQAEPTSRESCTPSSAVECVCDDGRSGLRFCGLSGFGACSCGDTEGDTGSPDSDGSDEGGSSSGENPVGTAGETGNGATTDDSSDSAGSTGSSEPGDTFCPGGVVRERLVEGAGSAAVVGGSFVPDVGWRTSSAADKIVWDLGQGIESGTLSFEVTGIHANVEGCSAGVCYYVGLFEEANGDKAGDYTGSAFIESRFHTNEQENFHDVFKLQAGTGNGDMLEPLTPPMGWSADQTHTVRIEWGPDPSDASRGRAWLYLDDQEAPLNYQAFYSDPTIGWRYLFLGTTQYKGLDWGMVDVTYRDLCLVAD